MLNAPLPPAAPGRTLLSGVRVESSGGASAPLAACARSLADTVDAVDLRLREAVARACADGIPAVLATGGLDSAVVAALVREVTGSAPTLVSAGCGLLTAVEEQLLGELGRALGCEQVLLDALPALDLGPLLRLNEKSDLPRGGVYTHVWDALCVTAAERGHSTLLTGVGGDELFSSGFPHAVDLLRGGHATAAMSVLGRTRPSDGRGVVGHAVGQLRAGCLPTKTAGGHQLVRQWHGRHADGGPASRRRRRAQFAAAVRAEGSTAGAEIAIRMKRLDLIAAADPSRRVHVRHPMAESAALRATVAGSPPHHRSFAGAGTADKALLRLVARRYLPAALSETRKTGSVNQIALLMSCGEMDPWARERLAEGGEWLGLRLDDRFWRPDRLPAEIGVDWTNLLAMCAWATNAL